MGSLAGVDSLGGAGSLIGAGSFAGAGCFAGVLPREVAGAFLPLLALGAYNKLVDLHFSIT